MRLLLWGLAAVALLATEPGKRLQKKAVCAFKDLKGKACGAESDSDGEEATTRTDSKLEKNDDEKDGNQVNGKRKLNDSASEESIENSGEGLDQKKAEELVEKLNTKPSAPEGELKSA